MCHVYPLLVALRLGFEPKRLRGSEPRVLPITLTENGGLRENRTPYVRRRVIYSHRARHALQPVAVERVERSVSAYEAGELPLLHTAVVAIPGIEPDYPGLQSGAFPLC